MSNVQLVFSDSDLNFSGTVRISVHSNPDPISVNYYIDNVLKASRTVDPFVWDWDTTLVSDGAHVVKAVGIYKNNRQVTDSENVTVANVATPPPPPSDTTPPTVPGSFAKTSSTETSISTSWTASTDAVGVAGYNVYKNGALVTQLDSTTLTYVFSSLTCGSSYSLSVEAFDAAGNKSAKSTITASTSACVVPPPPPPPPAPTAFYGVPIAADGLANLEIGGKVSSILNRQVAHRFKAAYSSALNSVTCFLKQDDASGYSAGTHGTIGLYLYACDSAAQGRPTGGALATATPVVHPGSAEFFYTFVFPTPYTLVAGTRYVLVWKNTDADNRNNYVSLNDANQPSLSPRQPYAPDTDQAVFYRDGGDGGTWNSDHAQRSPLHILNYANGSHQGNGYIDYRPSRVQNIGGNAKIRQTATPTSARTFSNVYVWIRKSGTPSSLIITVRSGSSTIASTSIAASSIGTSYGWVSAPLNVTLNANQAYTFEMSASTGTYQMFPYQSGENSGFVGGLLFMDGRYEWTTDGTNWQVEGQPHDIPIYFSSSAPPAPPPSSFPLPTYRITEPQGGGFHSYFAVHDSATRQVVGDGIEGNKHAIVMWDTAGGGPGPAKYSGLKMYALMGFRMVNGWGYRSFDWHNQPNDSGGVPNGWGPYPPDTSAVSPCAIDLDDYQSRGIHYVNEPDWPNHQHQIMTVAEAESLRGTWIWLWMELGIGYGNGTCKIWVAGEDTPRVNLTGLKTRWNNQHQWTYWEGAYNSSGFPAPCTIEIAATRLGRTPQECYNDVPVLHSSGQEGTGGTFAAIASRMSTEAAIPASLRW